MWWKRLKGALASRRRFQLSERERLFAAWLGLAAVMIATRLKVLQLAQIDFQPQPKLVPFLPLAAYQDISLLAFLSWGSWAILSLAKGSGVRRVVYIAAWMICVFTASYAVLSAALFRFFGSPLTYQQLLLSDHLHEVRSSLLHAASGGRLMKILCAPLLVFLFARAAYHFVPKLLSRVARGFHTPIAAACLLLYLLVAELWTAKFLPYRPAFCNPEWRFCQSLIDSNEPFVSGQFPKQYLDDFLPIGQRRRANPNDIIAPYLARPVISDWHPRNVVLVVVESLGSRYLGLYGERFANDSDIARLAKHGASFNRFYVSNPFSANAMAALSCSVYPYQSWQWIPLRAPHLKIPAIASVLNASGYRTAMIHSGYLVGDFEKDFLRGQGFSEVYDASDLPGVPHESGPVVPLRAWGGSVDVPRDSVLVPSATSWIDADRSRPFFLLLWTNDTHYPYASLTHEDFGVGDPELNRYLNAIKETDAVIGQLERALKAHGLADDTILVVTGDHGEQFGQHGHLGHGWSVYEEEVRVPLIIANPRLFPREVKIDRIGRQIDLAPTLLQLLGFNAPSEWQGQNLFAKGPPPRAYIFADYIFGLVEGNFKYIYNLNLSRAEVYDLDRDPQEQKNLTGAMAYSKQSEEAYQRLAAWSTYQNHYLDSFKPGGETRSATQISTAFRTSPSTPELRRKAIGRIQARAEAPTPQNRLP